MKAEELYEERIKPPPGSVRLRLAGLILNDIPPQSVVDYRDVWGDEDLHDFRTAGLKHIEVALDRADIA